MSLLGIPPWLAPTDVIGAMSAGGRLGLGQAELGERARESDQRTGLGYAQLGADQAHAGAALHAKLAENALTMALHQSAQEEQRRRDEMVNQAKQASEQETERKNLATETETTRAHTAAEDLKKKTLDNTIKKAQELQEAGLKKQQIDHAHRRVLEAEKFLHAAVTNGKGVEEAKKNLDDVRREYDTLTGNYSAMPELSTGDWLKAPPTTTLGGLLDPFAGQGFIKSPATSSGLKYTVEPVGE